MPFSHHSHSGQFCEGHAKDSLESIVQTAIAKKMQTYALTEHMPRHDQDRYHEEVESNVDLESMILNQANYVAEAQRLRQKYSSSISIPIGFESDWCGPHSAELIEQSLQTHPFDFYMGSIHHVRGIPIDYDEVGYEQARSLAGGTDERLFESYFDEQLEMLQKLRPPVVGHFDLIRLKSDNFNLDWQTMSNVWSKIERNLDFIASYGGILEINTAALRKGMNQPYPKAEICRYFISKGGRFCLSDDSHGIDQVATNYHRLLPFLDEVGLQTLTFLDYGTTQQHVAKDPRFPTLLFRSVAVSDIRQHETLTNG